MGSIIDQMKQEKGSINSKTRQWNSTIRAAKRKKNEKNMKVA